MYKSLHKTKMESALLIQLLFFDKTNFYWFANRINCYFSDMLNIIDLDNMFQRVGLILARIEAKVDLLLEQKEFIEKDRKVLLVLAKSLDRFSNVIEVITGGVS